jgi:hypothetical protein
MKRHRIGYRLLIIVACSWLAVTHVVVEVKSIQCILTKSVHAESSPCCPESPQRQSQEKPACSGMMEDNHDGSAPSPNDCGPEGYCKVCNSLSFLATNHSFVFALAPLSALAETHIPFPFPGFAFPLFKPPRS